MFTINDFGRYPLIMMPYQVESLSNFRVCGVDLTFPAPSQFGHRFLKSPSPVAPEPWHTEQVTSQSSARSYNLPGIKFTVFMRPLYRYNTNCAFTFSTFFPPRIPLACWTFVCLFSFLSAGILIFLVSTFFLGLSCAFADHKTSSIKWVALLHIIGSLLALGQPITTSIIAILGV